MIKIIDNILSYYKSIMEDYNFGESDFPISFNLLHEGSQKLLVVLGDNASGKSFLTSQLLLCAKDWANVKGYNVGMKTRTGGGMTASFMYGNETYTSTGVITLSAVVDGLKNCIEHSSKGQEMMLVLDEPTLGLSMRYERAMGNYIAEKIIENEENKNFKGLLLVTHSKDLVKSLIDNGADPSVLFVGDNGYDSVEGWLNSKESASVEELLNLKEKSHQTFLKVKNYSKDKK